MLLKAVATHRLKKMRHFCTVEKLVIWRRSNGFDRCDARDGQWIHSSLLPTSEETTASIWVDVNGFKKVISMPEKERSKQRVESFFNEFEQGTASLTDEEFTRLERIMMGRRGRTAAHVLVAPIDAAQLCNPRSSSERSFDVHVYMEGNTHGRWTRSEASSNHHRLVRIRSNHHRLVRVSLNHHRLVRIRSNHHRLVRVSLNHHRLVRISLNHHRLGRFLNTRTAVSPELGDGKNQCRRLLARRPEFVFFSLEELVCKNMTRKTENNEPASEENKQFDPGG